MKNLPEQFIDMLATLGHPAYSRLAATLCSTEPPVSVRYNPQKNSGSAPLFADILPVPWNSAGVYLTSRPAFTLDPRLHQGRYYVQEASSMAAAAAVSHAAGVVDCGARPLRFLDACAAPGGKTTAAIDVLPPDTFIVANEYDPRRAQVLTENLAKWGAEAFVSRGDAASMPFPEGFFDIIAADVPCSGEGMMRKDEIAVSQWSPRLVSECAERQRAIVTNLWKALRPGGYMIYSTCTFNLAENEEIVAYIIDELGAEAVEAPLDAPGIIGAQGGCRFPAYRFVPGEIQGEGLFLALLNKKTESNHPAHPKPIKNKAITLRCPIMPGDLLIGDYDVVSDSPLRLISRPHLALYHELAKHIKPLAAGIEPGTVKGRDFIPSQQLALSRHYRRGSYPEVEVDREAAIAYLRREALVLPTDAPRGIILLTFEDQPLGWVKNLSSRANNLYPDPWRIRH